MFIDVDRCRRAGVIGGWCGRAGVIGVWCGRAGVIGCWLGIGKCEIKNKDGSRWV